MNKGQPQAMPASTEGSTLAVTPKKSPKKMGSPSPPQQKAVSCISAASPNHVTPESVPPSDAAMIKQRPCSLCHEVEIPNTLTRCKECNKGYQRILLYKNQLNEASLDAWDNMSKEKKSAFIKENHVLTGENLKAKDTSGLQRRTPTKDYYYTSGQRRILGLARPRGKVQA